MPIQPVKIPQNVYIEDRIVGPLTLKQLIIVALGGGFSYMLWAMISKQYGVVPLPITILVWIPAAISMAFAFIRINDLSLTRMLFLTAERFTKPAVRTWTPRRGLTINISTKSEVAPPAPMPRKKMEAIEELTQVLDQPETESQPQPYTQPNTVTDLSATSEPESTLPRRPVNPSRIQVSPMNQAPATEGTVSLFRDLTPHQ